jgi:TfoX/Sxy family transcriptional regulator of competence genes
MAYDEELASRVREALQGEDAVTEKRMFGGLAFLVDGAMAVAANSAGALMLRVDPVQTGSLLRAPHVRRMVMRGREMDGWLQVDAEVLDSDEALQGWVEIGVARARSVTSS